jgi:predicted lipoprotein with Yx(FWY)xxD motif
MRAVPSSRHALRSSALRRVAATFLVAGAVVTTIGLSGASAEGQRHTAKSVKISTFNSAKYGTILSYGKTLYTLKPSATACTSACHKIWIEVLLPKGVTKATAGVGVNSAELGTTKVAGGLQVTYGGRALFWFFEDKAAGQVKGNVTDTWGKWTAVVVKRTGKPTTTTTQPTNTTTTTLPATTTTTSPGGGGGIGF